MLQLGQPQTCNLANRSTTNLRVGKEDLALLSHSASQKEQHSKRGNNPWGRPSTPAPHEPPSQAPRASETPCWHLQVPLREDLQEITLAQVSCRVTHKGRRTRPSSSPHSSLSRHSVGRVLRWAVLVHSKSSSSSNMQRNEAGSGDGPQRTRLLHKSPFHSLFAKNFNTKLNCEVAY